MYSFFLKEYFYMFTSTSPRLPPDFISIKIIHIQNIQLFSYYIVYKYKTIISKEACPAFRIVLSSPCASPFLKYRDNAPKRHLVRTRGISDENGTKCRTCRETIVRVLEGRKIGRRLYKGHPSVPTSRGTFDSHN